METADKAPDTLTPRETATLVASDLRQISAELALKIGEHEETKRATERLNEAAEYLENLANRLATPNTSPAH